MGGGNCSKNLKSGGTEKREGDTNISKRWNKLGQGVSLSPSKSPHFLWYLCYVLPLSHQHQPTMIKAIGSR